MNRYLVTGGSGFIGTNLVEFHHSLGDSVLNFDINEPRCESHRHLWVKGGLLDRNEMFRIFREFDPTHIYHLGARTDLQGRSIEEYAENTRGVDHVIEACSGLRNLKRVIFASSRLVCKIGHSPASYDDYCPTTAYGESKVVGELLVRRAALSPEWCIVRPTSIWGPWFGEPYRNFFDAVRRGVYLHPRNARIAKSFGYVGNTVYQLYKLMEVEGVNQRTFYLADYEPIDVYDLATRIATGFSVRKPFHVPSPILRGLAACGDLVSTLGIRSPLTSFRFSNLTTPMLHELSDLRACVGNLPFDVQGGVDETISWMKHHG